MDETDPRRIQRLKEERVIAQKILDDPSSSHLDRDLAHIRLKHDDGRKGVIRPLAKDGELDTIDEVPKEWRTIETYEKGLVSLTDQDAVAMVEDPLLRNKINDLKAASLGNGRYCCCPAYPKLMHAVENQLQTATGCNNSVVNEEMVASAYAVKACLLRMHDNGASVPYFKKAIKLRPKDWRLRMAIAGAYFSLGKTALSLEALTQAVKLTDENSYERYDVEHNRAKVLFNLQRIKEAKTGFLKTLVDAERFKRNPECVMTPLELGRLVVTEYMLCLVWGEEQNQKMLKHQWESAEKKRQALRPDTRDRIDWDSRLHAEQLIAVAYPALLSHQECHHCRQWCSNPHHCSACKVALYCSRACQVAAWKAGHKKQCKDVKATRKSEKKDRKEAGQKHQAASNLPPLDATLDPWVLWAKAKKLFKENGKTPLDAIFYFTVALFLDFSLDGEDLAVAKAAVDACNGEEGQQQHPLVLALGMITHMKHRGDISQMAHVESYHQMAINFGLCHDVTGTTDDATNESIDEVDKVRFGHAMCAVFHARMMSRIFSVTSQAQAESEMHKGAFDRVVELTDSITDLYLSPQRWLTMQFELGFTNLDIGAVDEGERWLQMFVNNLTTLEKQKNSKLTKHWKKMRKSALTKLQMAQMIRAAQMRGMAV